MKFVVETARVRAAAGQLANARRSLDAAFLEASRTGLRRTGLRNYQLESRLAKGEVELQSGRMTLGRAYLTALEKEALASGYILIARKAAANRKSRNS